LAKSQGMWVLGWGFGWVRCQFSSGSRHVGLGLGFRVGDGLIWFRVKACGAWDGVLCGFGVDLAQGQDT
jgi:hypothetical protein